MFSSYQIADYFVWLSNQTGSCITNLKLQKLVYYAQAWHLALNNTPLFEEDFEAWIHGPVIPNLYQEYKDWGWKPIEKEVDEPIFCEEICHFLEELAEVYFSCDAYELERMTHQEAPWIIARNGLPTDAPSNETISKESMKTYYSDRAEQED